MSQDTPEDDSWLEQNRSAYITEPVSGRHRLKLYEYLLLIFQ